MSRGRFALLVTLLAVGAAALSFTAALQLLDDGRSDPPPSPGSVDATDTTLPPADATSTTTTASPTTTRPGALATPAWVTIIASEASRTLADQAASPVTAAGYPTGVLHSDDYASLKPGLWVAYAGPYPDAAAARAAVAALAADGFPGAYVRCVGTKKACSGNPSDD